MVGTRQIITFQASGRKSSTSTSSRLVSHWGFQDEKCEGEVTTSFSDFDKKYLQDVTSSQLVDGLDTFYKDHRNRRITISKGVWLVLNSIAGRPQSELDKMIETFRKNAVDSAVTEQ